MKGTYRKIEAVVIKTVNKFMKAFDEAKKKAAQAAEWVEEKVPYALSSRFPPWQINKKRSFARLMAW